MFKDQIYFYIVDIDYDLALRQQGCIWDESELAGTNSQVHHLYHSHLHLDDGDCAI